MMHVEEIIRYLNSLRNGGEVENPKFELKRQWWSLDEDAGKNEFLKDITAMANTPGGDGYILVGIDKNGILHNCETPLDPSKIRGIICKNVQEAINLEVYDIEVEGSRISVIHIPRSLNKPHIIKEYRTSNQVIRMFIPIRKGTSINPADKYDIDLMYLERNNRIVINYDLSLKVTPSVLVNIGGGGDIGYETKIEIPVMVINNGTNVNCITSGRLIVEECDDSDLIGTGLNLEGVIYEMVKHYIKYTDYLTLKSNDISRAHLVFGFNRDMNERILRRRNEINIKFILEVQDVAGKVYYSDKFSIGN
jgi:hypothetical protein